VTDSANVALVRSIFAAWARGDFAAEPEWADPQIEWVMVDGPVTGTSTGRAGLAAGTRDVLNVWHEARIEPEEYRELDGERVVVLVRAHGRGKMSGVDLTRLRSEGAWVVHVRDSMVTKLVRYWDRDRALADLGLTPDTGT
jgi:ketosteroid isomerase-like protein